MSEPVARPCGCLGVGRHRNSCPLKTGLASDATLPDVNSNREAPKQGFTFHGPPRDGLALATMAPQEVAPEPVAPPPAPTFYGLPIMPDEWLEQYGGDLSAIESWSPKSGHLMATVRSSKSAGGPMPDLAYKGMLVYRHAPEKQFHFVYLLEDGSSNYQVSIGTLRQRGYRPVTVADFLVHSTLRDGVLISDDGTANGRLTLGGALKGGMTVVYRQDKASYDQWRNHDRRFSDQIQMTADEQAARMQENLVRDGFQVTTEATYE